MTVLTPAARDAIEHEAATTPTAEVVAWLADRLGARMTAHLAGLKDVKQISRYRRKDGPSPSDTAEMRLREGFKIVRTIVGAYDAKTAKVWLFGSNSRLDDEAPIDVIRAAKSSRDVVPVLRAARQLATFEN